MDVLQMCGFTEKAQTKLEQHYHNHFDFIKNVDVHLECTDATTPIGFGFSVDVAALPLQYLNLAGCGQVTDAGLIHISSLPLKCLDITYCAKITQFGVQHIKSKNPSIDLKSCVR